MTELYLGIDIGSTTVKAVVVDEAFTLRAASYRRSHGQPRQALLEVISDLAKQVDVSRVAGVGLTGSGGESVARLIGGTHVNELVAQTRAVGFFHPEARTVIEIGGQDSKLLSVDWDEANQRMRLIDFAMNALCAAGTGSFLDQQAERLGISIDSEFGALAVQATNPARIAGRCTVFAKSDMIHLQQTGTPLPDILAGLCLALARNFKSVIGRGKSFRPPVMFQGGVACNAGVVRAFESVLNLAPGELIVPQHHTVMAALGAAFLAVDDAARGRLTHFAGLEQLAADMTSVCAPTRTMPPLQSSTEQAATRADDHCARFPAGGPVFLGIDVGSISTNLVLLDEGERVLARQYLATAGQPLQAVSRGLTELSRVPGPTPVVRGVGVTGSGRYLTGEFVGADLVRNEITAQARAAVAIDPSVDTIFEIGGQDSKYIRLQQGVVVDFAMNSACAAGTGSFLEEQAERLGIDITSDFSRLACSSPNPTCLGERCTVFMESDLVHHQQQGASVADLTGGLAYAVAQNYLNRVVNGRPLGRRILFQGGVAGNESVRRAFEQLTRRTINVPPNHDVTGAIGAAILALEAFREGSRGTSAPASKFKGFNVADQHYESSLFECQACPNICEIKKVTIAEHPPIFYGARCDRFEEAGRRAATNSRANGVPDLFAERDHLLFGEYAAPTTRGGRLRLGLPRALLFHELFPYWRTLFEALDVDVVLSTATNPGITARTAEHAAAEACFPAKLMFGHVLDLLDADLDFIFMPSVANREDSAPGQAECNYCTFIPAMPHLITAHVEFGPGGPRPLKLPFHMQWPAVMRRELRRLAEALGVAPRRVDAADKLARAAQDAFYASLVRRGREVLESVAPDQLAAVIVGRPYNTCDAAVCQDLPTKLRRMGVLPIPMDFLPIYGVEVQHPSDMFWRSGQAILAAARIIRDDPRLHAVYVTNFNCGPDSFLVGFFRRALGGKPVLELEFDDHTADAGVVTRCEAFFDGLRMREKAVL